MCGGQPLISRVDVHCISTKHSLSLMMSLIGVAVPNLEESAR